MDSESSSGDLGSRGGAHNSNDIRQKYTLDELEEEDPATKEWCKLIDLDTVIESKLDWHSTRTFELFLDALDVNQPIVIKNDKKSNPTTKSVDTTTTTTTTTRTQQQPPSKVSPIHNGLEDKNKIAINNTSARQNGAIEPTKQPYIPINNNKNGVDTYQGVETILSAEALKILSELPDLSHMSTTKSFIFPTRRTVRK